MEAAIIILQGLYRDKEFRVLRFGFRVQGFCLQRGVGVLGPGLTGSGSGSGSGRLVGGSWFVFYFSTSYS